MRLSEIRVQNKQLGKILRPRYTEERLGAIEALLDQYGALTIPQLETGLYAASGASGGDADLTGYRNTWVRDTVMIAESDRQTGRPERAAKTMRALLRFYRKTARRFEDIIAGRADPDIPMNRPHIRFDGNTLEERPEKWAHAQNDALGNFLRLTCRLALEGALELDAEERGVLARFPPYFLAIRYWQDRDSGHWEETRKVETSSIGPALAGLRAFRELLRRNGAEVFRSDGAAADETVLDRLIAEGERALEWLLPWESRGNADPALDREVDAAQIGLAYPSEAIPLADWPSLLDRVFHTLGGPFGVKRYRGDSYWCGNYKSLLDAETRCADFSDDLGARDRLMAPGTEAQWCLFDPALSAAWGRLFESTGDPACFERQTWHFNRSLGQITGDGGAFAPGLCPELYYLEDSARGEYVPNDNTPLRWTQANLAVALHRMKQSAARAR